MCPPFGEEKKSSYRIFAEQAEHIAELGVHVIRFDYFGTGDSPGVFHDADLDIWRDDLQIVSKFARRQTGASRLCLLGLRLGATLALGCPCDRLVLWQPMVDTGAYIKANARKQTIRHKLISEGGGEEAGFHGRTGTGYGSPERIKETFLARPSEARDRGVSPCNNPQGVSHRNSAGAEIDGYQLSEAMLNSMNKAVPAIDHPDCLLIQISYTEDPLPEYASHTRGKDGMTFQTLRMEPFWNRIGRVDPSPLIKLTSGWILA